MAPRKKKPAPARKAAKPPVLNLKATEVKSATEKAEEKLATQSAPKPKTSNADSKKSENGKPASSSKPTSPSAKKSVKSLPEKKNNKTTTLVLVSLAALVAAGLGGAWAFKTYGSQYFADPNAVRAEQLGEVVARVAKLEAAAVENQNNSELLASLKQQLDQADAALNASKATIAANAEKLANLEKTASEVRVALAKAVEDGKGPVAAANELQFQALSEKLAGLEKNLSALKSAPVADNSKELENLTTRFDALLVRLNATEQQTGAVAKSIDLLKAAQEKLASSPAGNPASELARAFTVLRAKISSGGAFEAELDSVAGQMPEETALDALRPFAEKGVPTMAGLTSALRKVELASGSAKTETPENNDSGVFGALTNRLTGLVKVTKAGQSDWSELKQKALQALAAGQVESAAGILREGANTPEGVAAWLALADNKIKVDQAVKGLSAKIVTRLTAGGE
ncbi:hypothetical protein MNBD_ALPHA08-2405 [hydrothermal vent metagenome]|uniref:Uncharacterized protein n=1 Tax=hydrothermal vent metagenome TaxID=652676 RepID=A0A3B0R8W4_9ZZZZ